MAGFFKTFAAIAVALLPGGFLLLLAYVATRIVRHRQAALEGAKEPASLRAALSSLTMSELVKEARATF